MTIMIYEMRTYSFLPTDLPKYLKHAEEVGRPVRGNDYGVNCGYWISEFGRLNQVWHLWRYDSYAQREELRAKLSQNSDWTDKYVAVIKEWVKRQDIRILNPHSEFALPEVDGNIYEYRYYRTSVGGATHWLNLFKARYHIARSIQNLSDFGILRRDNRTRCRICGFISTLLRAQRHGPAQPYRTKVGALSSRWEDRT